MEPVIDLRDRAMGLEQQAIELESEVEWAEAQGRYDDVRSLHRELVGVLDELATVSTHISA